MRFATYVFCALMMGILLFAPPSYAQQIDGTIRLGGTFLDETAGDLSVMQEAYDIYEDFSVTQVYLHGAITPRSYFSMNLSNINLDNRQATFNLRVPGHFRFYTKYDEHRHVYDTARNSVMERRDTQLGMSVTPVRWLALSASYNHQMKQGDRLFYPAGNESNLGLSYDHLLQTGRIEARVQHMKRNFAVSYDFSRLGDNLSNVRDRGGNLVAVRLFTPCLFTDKLHHSLRVAYGTQELSDLDLDYTLKTFQYKGIVRPARKIDLTYGFYASRIDDEATGLLTDHFRHSIDGEYHYFAGRVFAGYSYETRDDDNALTSYHGFRTGATINHQGIYAAKIKYARRLKNDVDNEEKHTLLQESDSDRLAASLNVRATDRLTIGGKYRMRNRDLPDINVHIDGSIMSAFARYRHASYGSVMLDYSYARNTYDNREGDFETDNHSFTSKVEVDYIEDVRLAGGVTTVDIGRDLDIEKSIIFLEAGYTYDDRYLVDVKYNVYNFDDFVVLNRYYTANVVWFNVGYNFQIQ